MSPFIPHSFVPVVDREWVSRVRVIVHPLTTIDNPTPPGPLSLTSYSRLPRFHHRVDDADRRRAHEYHEDAGEDEQDQREDQLHRGLGGLLLGDLLAAGPHGIGLHTERLG